MKKLTLLLFLAVFSFQTHAQDSVVEKIKAAMKSDIRTEKEIARDRNRKPLETLSFFQLKDDMRVLELGPSSGWYTKILAPTLRENGELYVAFWTDNIKSNLITKPGFEHIKVIDGFKPSISESDRYDIYDLDAFSFGVTGLDLVVTFRNIHNFTEKGRESINQATYDALKSGGLYGVVDHTRRHMQAYNSENRRRADPVVIIKELLDVGFEFVDHSNLHYRLDDELRYEVGRPTVTGHTDRFTFLFRKP